MITLLLVVHVAAAILFIGPATLATSVFARYAAPSTRDVALAMHSVSRTYGTASLVVAAAGVVFVREEQRWDFRETGAVLLAAVIPFGGYLAECRLSRTSMRAPAPPPSGTQRGQRIS
jgi:hypothetical protein